MSVRTALLIAIVFGVAATASTAFAQPVYYGEEPGVQAPSGPPLDQVETPPPPPPGATVFWKPGHWKYKHDKWEWIPGKYIERPAPAATWVPGHYVLRPYGYVYVPGYWL